MSIRKGGYNEEGASQVKQRPPDPPPSNPKKPAPEPIEIFDCAQESEEWFKLHIGCPSASTFKAIMAEGADGGDAKTRTKLLYQMAGEIITGAPRETFSSFEMQRGKEQEPEAREHYAFTRAVELTRVGFVRRTLPGNRFVGCSPDSLIGSDGILEIKTMRPDLMIELLHKPGVPPGHRAQCQGSLWVTGRAWLDLVIFYRNMPVMPTFKIERDEVYIKQIANEVERFEYELKKLVERVRGMTR